LALQLPSGAGVALKQGAEIDRQRKRCAGMFRVERSTNVCCVSYAQVHG